MDDYGINEAYFKAANKSEQVVVEKKTEKIHEARLDEMASSKWIDQIGVLVGKNEKDGGKLADMIEDWIVKYPRSYKSSTPLLRLLIDTVWEANGHIPMMAIDAGIIKN